jgi:hypothetical protein
MGRQSLESDVDVDDQMYDSDNSCDPPATNVR